MVTKSQKEILDNLTTQFENLNTQSKVEGSLINISEILDQHEDNKKRVAEVNLNNEEFKKLRQQIISEWAGKLNKDLNKIGLNATVPNTYFINIGALEGHLCHSKELTIYVEIADTSEMAGVRRIYVCHGIKYSYSSKSTTNGKRQYESMDDLITSELFQKDIKGLFNQINVVELT